MVVMFGLNSHCKHQSRDSAEHSPRGQSGIVGVDGRDRLCGGGRRTCRRRCLVIRECRYHRSSGVTVAFEHKSKSGCSSFLLSRNGRCAAISTTAPEAPF